MPDVAPVTSAVPRALVAVVVVELMVSPIG